MAELPKFIERDPVAIMAEIKAQFEGLLGRELQPAQVESLIAQLIGYREILLYERFNAGASQLLYQFSKAPMLDYIAALVAVERLPPAIAGCTVVFTLVPGHGNVVVPDGTRVATNDNKVIFQTNGDITVTPSVNSVETFVTAQVPGKAANGYEVGAVTKILDPRAFVFAVTNITPTGGGSDDESDESLRERIRLAPSQFTTAGSRQSYLFHARRANAAIIDVSVSSPIPGTVYIVPLIHGSVYGQVLSDINFACSAETVRPLCDTVIVSAPSMRYYTIEVEIVAYNTVDDLIFLKNKVRDILQEYANSKSNKLGLDIVRSHITQHCRLREVYDINVVAPASNIEVDFDEVPICSNIIVTITGVNHG